MLVMFDVTDPVEGMHTMTKREGKAELIELKGLLERDEDSCARRSRFWYRRLSRPR
jgi:hypothetical protein